MALSVLVVRRLSCKATQGVLEAGGWTFPCALGRSGSNARKREGDGATPRGTFRMLRVLYRADRRRRPRCGLPVTPIRPFDGWCDAVFDRNYNRQVRLPSPCSHETLTRADDVYDLIVVLDHNSRPRVHGHGSAVFMHIARANFEPTAGCIALAVGDLERVLAEVGPGTRITIP